MPAALLFCTAVAGYLNKTYSMKMVTGAELFGHTRVYWFYDVTNLDEVAQLNAKLMQDRPYVDMLEKATLLWLEGRMKDNIVKLLG